MEREKQTIYGVKDYYTHGSRFDFNNDQEIPIVINSLEDWCEFLEKVITSDGVRVALEYARNNFKWYKHNKTQVMDALAIAEHVANLRKSR